MTQHPGWTWSQGDVRMLFSARTGGRSSGAWSSCNIGGHVGDEPDAVLANRALLTGYAGLDPARVATVDQVHGADVWIDLGHDAAPLPSELSWSVLRSVVAADALVTSRTGMALAVAVADCAPIGLSWGPAIAMVHAGWRGLVGGVLEASLSALRRAAGAAVSMSEPPRAVVGPHIGSCCFDVGAEVAAQFADRSVVQLPDGRLRVSLLDAVRARLEPRGVVVESLGPCTACTPRLCFSHRRDGAPSGRQAGLIWRVR